MSNDLFTDEMKIQESWQQLIDDGKSTLSIENSVAFLDAYKRLLKNTKRLVRHSDRVENKLKIAAKAETEKSEQLENLSKQLSKYLSPQIYEQIFSGSTSVNVESERKKLTVFFSDIVGFTQLTEALESESVVELLNHYLTEMSSIALKHGATIDKFVGDAIMIFFGDPESEGSEKDALKCVNMALEMQKKMSSLTSFWGKNFGLSTPLQIRMGINTGYCTVGNFGSADRIDYTAIGAGVNLAARLESAAKPGSILISSETFLMIGDHLDCKEQGSIVLKGISAPVTTYVVLGSRSKQDTISKVQTFIDQSHISDLSASELRELQRIISNMLS